MSALRPPPEPPPPTAPAALATPRLWLRQWRDEDFEPFAALNADPQVMAHFPAALTRERSDALAAASRARIAERGWGNWAVERRDTGAFIGFVGLSVPRADLPCSPCVEIGWRLAARHWGQGLASEAAQAVLRHGFEVLRLGEIVSLTAEINAPSRAVMARLGMRESPGEAFEHPSVPEGHALRWHCLYRLARADWAATLR